jgi:predicted RecB family nuclease
MVEKISRQALDNYFACKFKAHLTVSGARGVPSEYLNLARDQDRRFKRVYQQQLLKTHAEGAPKRVTLTRSLLSVGYPLILEATFDDERLHLQFDGIMKVDGASAIGPFHYAPILFHAGQTIRQPQKQLLEVYAVVLEALQDRAPRLGIVFHRGCTEARVRLSPDAPTLQNVMQNLKGILGGDIPALRLNDHCQICEFRRQCHAQAVKEDNISQLRGISDTEIMRLRSKGIFTVNQLSYTFRSRRIAKRAKTSSTPPSLCLSSSSDPGEQSLRPWQSDSLLPRHSGISRHRRYARYPLLLPSRVDDRCRKRRRDLSRILDG